MDKAKKRRTVQRSAFTKALNAFQETVSGLVDNRASLVAFKILEERMDELNATTVNVLDLMLDDAACSEAVLQQEYTDADEYKSKFLTAKFAMEEREAARHSETLPLNAPVMQGESRKTFKLPKIEFIKFSGDMRGWLQF